MLLKEHKHRPISGDILLIGRQTVLLTIEEALRLIGHEGIVPRSDFLRQTDTTTVGSDVGEYITDQAFFSMFSDAKVLALDVSDYEGAEIVHDLNAPLPAKYEGIADFIFNGSCLDNLFDPATAIKSMSRMLRPNGRVMHLEHGSPIQDAFLCYSPEWFFDFYAINDYADCQLFVCTFGSSLQNAWEIAKWHPFHEADGQYRTSRTSLWLGDFMIIAVAEKSAQSTDNNTPIQSHYRSLQSRKESDLYLAKHIEFAKSGRRYAFDTAVIEPPPPPPPAPPPPPPPMGLTATQSPAWPSASRATPPPLSPIKRIILSAAARCGIAIHKGGPFRYKLALLVRPDPGPNEAHAQAVVPDQTELPAVELSEPISIWLNRVDVQRLGVLQKAAPPAVPTQTQAPS